jgi:hypothetical protein
MIPPLRSTVGLLLLLVLAVAPLRRLEARPPYPASAVITAIHWDFAGARPLRKAVGSDIWPCSWAFDDRLYCAWGDGGGFGGTDSVGRVSLGFARVSGTPHVSRPSSYRGSNIWGAPPHARYRATFGGKVGSIIAVDGALYAPAGLWTRQNSKNPVATWSDGPLERMIWSFNLGKTWRIAPWAPSEDLGAFLQFGRDSANAPRGYIYIYYGRPDDLRHFYLRRVPLGELLLPPQSSHAEQYLAYVSRDGEYVSWSRRPQDAIPVFTDVSGAFGENAVFDPALGRYLLTVGHNASGRPAGASPGQLGVFESVHPWGPWRTIYYADDWGHFPASAQGDFLGLSFPAKWISHDGRRLWGVFSGPDGLDAFNLVRAQLETRAGHPMHAPLRAGEPDVARCAEREVAVNHTVFGDCPIAVPGAEAIPAS